jgi:hypothetical protein
VNLRTDNIVGERDRSGGPGPTWASTVYRFYGVDPYWH